MLSGIFEVNPMRNDDSVWDVSNLYFTRNKRKKFLSN